MRVELLAQPFFVHFADRSQRQAVHLNKAIRQFEVRHALFAQVTAQHIGCYVLTGTVSDITDEGFTLTTDETTYIVHATAEQLAHYQGPTYAMFELDFGVRMVRAEEKIRAVLPDETQAQWLNVPAGTPLLSVERLAYTYNDVPMELRRGLYRTDTHHYHNKLN